jgi:hypothetical protein
MFKLFQELKPLTDQLPSEEEYRKKEPGGGASMSQYAAAMEIALRVKKAIDTHSQIAKKIALTEAHNAYGMAALLYNVNLFRADDLPESVREEARRLARTTVLSYSAIRDRIQAIVKQGHAAEVAADVVEKAVDLHFKHNIPYGVAEDFILKSLCGATRDAAADFGLRMTEAVKVLELQRRRRKYYTIVLSTILILYILIIILY